MEKYIIILYTRTNGSEHYQKISDLLNDTTFVISWTLDLSDNDKVLRVESAQEIGNELQVLLLRNGIISTVEATYLKDQ